MANSARVKSRQGKKAANNRRQTLGLPRFDQTQFGKSSGLGELSAFGSCLEKGLEVGLVGAFKAPSEATAERLDEIAELGRLRCSSQETKHLALIVSERTCLGKPIQALLKRRGLWRGLPGRSYRVGAPCPPRGRGYRRCNRRPSARRDDCGCKLSQPQWAGIAFDPADNIRICPWRSGQAARSQCVGQETAQCPSFVGVHSRAFGFNKRTGLERVTEGGSGASVRACRHRCNARWSRSMGARRAVGRRAGCSRCGGCSARRR